MSEVMNYGFVQEFDLGSDLQLTNVTNLFYLGRGSFGSGDATDGERHREISSCTWQTSFREFSRQR